MDEKISLKHGEGTKASYDLIKNIFIKRFSNNYLDKLGDSAVIGDRIFTCDGFTVDPIFFPSADIGKLAVCGTVNDIYVSAGIPEYISCAIIAEEGLPVADLEKIASSIKSTSLGCGIKIACGDFKVAEAGKADKIFITTSGIGRRIKKKKPGFNAIKNKDKIIVTGSVGEHGIAILCARKKLLELNIKSDCAPLVFLPKLWNDFPCIRFMRDPTRGGIAAVLNEITLGCGMGIRIAEEDVPVKPAVAAACEILGIDPYYLACEGRALIIAPADSAKSIIKTLKKYAPQAAVIGEIDSGINGVVAETTAGGSRLLDFSHSYNIPRIC